METHDNIHLYRYDDQCALARHGSQVVFPARLIGMGVSPSNATVSKEVLAMFVLLSACLLTQVGMASDAPERRETPGSYRWDSRLFTTSRG